MKNVLVGYLSYLTSENKSIRQDMVDLSAKSFFECFHKQDCEIIVINNGDLVSKHVQSLNQLKLSKNYYDVAVHFCTAFLASRLNLEYFMYTYDDFIYYDDSFLSEAISFLETTKIKSMRLPSYKFNDPFFNTHHTTKQQNPDAVRHEFGANGEPLFQKHASGRCYLTNWRPNSRPMLWNTEFFIENFIPPEHSTVMQTYEGYMYDVADKLASNNQWLSSFIDNGICKTFPVETSVRSQRSIKWWDNVSISVGEIRNEVLNHEI